MGKKEKLLESFCLIILCFNFFFQALVRREEKEKKKKAAVFKAGCQ